MLAGKSRGIGFSQVGFTGRWVQFDIRVGLVLPWTMKYTSKINKESEILKSDPVIITLSFDEEKTVQRQSGKSTLHSWFLSLTTMQEFVFPRVQGCVFGFVSQSSESVDETTWSNNQSAEPWSKWIRCCREPLIAFRKCLQSLSVLFCIKLLADVAGTGRQRRLQDARWCAWGHLFYTDKIRSDMRDI